MLRAQSDFVPKDGASRCVVSGASEPMPRDQSSLIAGTLERRQALVEGLRDRLAEHIASLRLEAVEAAGSSDNALKGLIRASHAAHRREFLRHERPALRKHVARLIVHFPQGHDIRPERIDPELVPVVSDTDGGLLFRLATTLWSVPVSRGYGRRMRFLVIDRSNDKLIGILALGDPVFNLRVRDDWIGWSVRERENRLVNVMDAYVVGAVPPYSFILGGKLMTSLLGCSELATHFETKYRNRRGIISGQVKDPKLALVTVTSALGRSSMYDRVRLEGLVDLVRVGMTEGWGHFHVPDDMFIEMRELLAVDGHPYASGHSYGNGPNWRIRVIREALERIGLDGELLRHGIAREVFAMPLAENWREYLRGQSQECVLRRPSLGRIAEASLKRWVIPRSERRPGYKEWTWQDTMNLLEPIVG